MQSEKERAHTHHSLLATTSTGVFSILSPLSLSLPFSRIHTGEHEIRHKRHNEREENVLLT